MVFAELRTIFLVINFWKQVKLLRGHFFYLLRAAHLLWISPHKNLFSHFRAFFGIKYRFWQNLTKKLMLKIMAWIFRFFRLNYYASHLDNFGGWHPLNAETLSGFGRSTEMIQNVWKWNKRLKNNWRIFSLMYIWICYHSSAIFWSFTVLCQFESKHNKCKYIFENDYTGQNIRKFLLLLCLGIMTILAWQYLFLNSFK